MKNINYNNIKSRAVLVLLTTAMSCVQKNQVPSGLSTQPVRGEDDSCAEFHSVYAAGKSDIEKLERLRSRCESRLKQRAIEIIELYHRGDCKGLTNWMSHNKPSRSEQAFIGYILKRLGDDSGCELFASSFPIDDDPTGLGSPYYYLPEEEGCRLESCLREKGRLCSSWFGVHAGKGCIPTEYKDARRCMPGFCREPHKMLVVASIEDWPGARKALVREISVNEGRIYSDLCHCGMRTALPDKDSWLSLSDDLKERKTVLECFEDDCVYDPEKACRKMVPLDGKAEEETSGTIQPRCGMPSQKRERSEAKREVK